MQWQNEIINTRRTFQESTTLTPAFKTASSSCTSGRLALYFIYTIKAAADSSCTKKKAIIPTCLNHNRVLSAFHYLYAFTRQYRKKRSTLTCRSHYLVLQPRHTAVFYQVTLVSHRSTNQVSKVFFIVNVLHALWCDFTENVQKCGCMFTGSGCMGQQYHSFIRLWMKNLIRQFFFFLSKTRISEFPSLNFDLIIFSAVQNIPFQNRLSARSAVLPRNLQNLQSVSHSTVTA